MRWRSSTTDNFEVIVLDNNTKDEAVWRPVEAHCARLGERFRFFHYRRREGLQGRRPQRGDEAHRSRCALHRRDRQRLPGRALLAAPRAAAFRRARRRARARGRRTIRDGRESLFKTMCFEEYRGFFHIGMVERKRAQRHHPARHHDHRAQGRAGGSGRLGPPGASPRTPSSASSCSSAAHSAAYIPESLGRGLTPDTLAAFMSQRHRWV